MWKSQDDSGPLAAKAAAGGAPGAAGRAGLLRCDSESGVGQAKTRQQQMRHQQPSNEAQADDDANTDDDDDLNWDITHQDGKDRVQKNRKQPWMGNDKKVDSRPTTPGEEAGEGVSDATEVKAQEKALLARRGEQRVAVVKAQRERDREKQKAETERQVSG